MPVVSWTGHRAFKEASVSHKKRLASLFDCEPVKFDCVVGR